MMLVYQTGPSFSYQKDIIESRTITGSWALIISLSSMQTEVSRGPWSDIVLKPKFLWRWVVEDGAPPVWQPKTVSFDCKHVLHLM